MLRFHPARRYAALIALLILLLPILAACGDEGGETGAETGETTIGQTTAGETPEGGTTTGETTGATEDPTPTPEPEEPAEPVATPEEPMTPVEETPAEAGGTPAAGGPVEQVQVSGAAPEGGPVTALSQWGGTEREGFEAVLNWCNENYNTQATYEQVDDIPAVLQTRAEGGNPPDVALFSSPSLAEQFARGNAIQPLTFIDQSVLEENFAPAWLEVGTFDGQLYALPMKAANKSLVWYDPQRFEEAGYQVPQTYDELVQLSEQIAQSGEGAPWAFGVSDAWTLTDFFENAYLRVAGPEMYDQLVDHEIPWTHPTVKQTFEEMNRIIAQDNFIAGGRSRALGQGWSDAATSVFQENPQAWMFQEADFVGAAMRQELPQLQPGEDFSAFAFPPIGQAAEGPTPVVAGPDVAVMFRDTPGARALMACLVDPRSTEQWVRMGGYTAPNRNVPLEAYPNDLARFIAEMTRDAAEANVLRLDGSDLMPPQFGSGYLWQALQRWFQNPQQIDPLLQDLENQAQRFYRE